MTKIITSDRRMLDLIQLSKTVAQSKATVLIQGESGTGKELLANVVHYNSMRARRPFVAINCAAIPENLLESELFGYERGAFTGAVTSKTGKFEHANGGTLLLDEISEMDLKLQAKLLRVIQQGEVDRIGGRRPTSVDVRLIATTNRNLSERVTSGDFREDLFYRLNVVHLTIPPLRDRIGDVKILVSHFAKIYSERNTTALKEFSDEAISVLNAHYWPGNVRELSNVVERALVTSKEQSVSAGHIQIDDHRAKMDPREVTAQDKFSWIPGKTLDDLERDVILGALEYHKGNRTHTARALGISIRTLRNKLAEYRRSGIHV